MQSIQRVAQKSEKKSLSLNKTAQKTLTEDPLPSLKKSAPAPSDKSIKVQKEVDRSPPPAVQKTPSKKVPAINKLDMAKKELEIILEREKEEKLILKDMEGRSYCCVEDCGFSAVVEGYCRLHYMGNWEHITKRNKILKTGLLEKLIDQMMTDHSKTILNYLLQDFKQEKTFTAIVKSFLEEDEEIESEDTLLS